MYDCFDLLFGLISGIRFLVEEEMSTGGQRQRSMRLRRSLRISELSMRTHRNTHVVKYSDKRGFLIMLKGSSSFYHVVIIKMLFICV